MDNFNLDFSPWWSFISVMMGLVVVAAVVVVASTKYPLEVQITAAQFSDPQPPVSSIYLNLYYRTTPKFEVHGLDYVDNSVLVVNDRQIILISLIDKSFSSQKKRET